jgi:hypothetical protein
MSNVAASKGVPVLLFNNVKSGTSNPIAIPNTCNNLRFHLKSNGLASAGALVIEEALDPSNPQTWSTIQTIQLPTIGTDSEQVVHIAGTFSVIRVRFSTAWSGNGGLFATLVAS